MNEKDIAKIAQMRTALQKGKDKLDEIAKNITALSSEEKALIISLQNCMSSDAAVKTTEEALKSIIDSFELRLKELNRKVDIIESYKRRVG